MINTQRGTEANVAATDLTGSAHLPPQWGTNGTKRDKRIKMAGAGRLEAGGQDAAALVGLFQRFTSPSSRGDSDRAERTS